MTASASWRDISLAGTFDLHVHAGPDTRPRWYSAFEMAERAAAAGMAGFVLKNHQWETANLAAEVRRRFPGLLVHGGIVLNRAAGGFDAKQVARTLATGGRIVWLPIVDGRGECDHFDRRGALRAVDEHGQPVAELRQVFEEIAKADAILATGHIALDEVSAVIRTARRDGVRRILLNHPEIPFLRFPVELQVEIQKSGAYIEHCYPRPESTAGFDGIAREIRAVGVGAVVLATDLGRIDLPDPLEGLQRMMAAMLDRGFDEEELSLMTRTIPVRLIDPATPFPFC